MVFDRILEKAFSHTVLGGTLIVHLHNGRTFQVGDGSAPRSAIRFHDAGAVRELVADPELVMGELYTDGCLALEEGDLMDFFAVLLGTTHGSPPLRILRLRERIRTLGRRLTEANSLGRSRRNVAHHYDLDDRLYRLFLDADRQYSCAYYETPDVTLDEAQRAKKRHIAAKLLAGPGQRVLDIGCGWGGLGLYLAEVAGCEAVRGITLSREQLGVAQDRARERGSALPRTGRGSAELPTWCISNSRTTGARRAPSTASSPSACSSTSARRTTMPSSALCASASPTMAWR